MTDTPLIIAYNNQIALYSSSLFSMDRATSFFWPPNQNSIWSPERLAITISNQKSVQITQPGFIQKIQPNVLPNNPSRVHLKFPAKNPPKSPSRGPFKIFQEHFIWRSEFTPIRLPQQNSIQMPQQHTFYRITPTENPFKYPTCHPCFTPTNTPSNLPTPNPSHIWAIPGHICGHTGHTVLIIKAGSHFRLQSRIQ